MKMPVDPVDVFGHALALAPVRLALACVVAGVGGYLPLTVDVYRLFVGRGGFPEGLGWAVLASPVYLFLVAATSGWWSLVALPLLLGLAYQVVTLPARDDLPSGLMIILTLAYWTAIRQADDLSLGILLGVVLIGLTHKLVRRAAGNSSRF
jgi:hypothetical protein